jgi:tetratricopeptide (TPR) repeat protein
MAIEPELDTLEAKGLIRLAAYRPELEYLFRHWLVQDAAYGSLLKQERRELHRQVGDALELLYPERRAELAAVLAMHYEEAGETEKALEHLLAAGRYSLDRNAIQEAYSAFDRAATLLPPAREDEDDTTRRRRIEIASGRTRAGWSFRPPQELIADLEGILPEAERLGDPQLIAPIHLSLAWARLALGESTTSPSLKHSLDRVNELGAQLDDPSLRALPLALVGTSQALMGPIRDGLRALEEAVPLLESRQDFIAAAFARGALAIGYGNLGEFDKAEQAARNAVELAANGDLIAQLDAAIAESMVRSARGQLDDAVPLAKACINRAEETGASACIIASSWVLGDAYQRQGRLAEARETLQRGMDLAVVVDRKVWQPSLQAWLGSTVAALGDGSEGDWEESLETARSIGNHMGEAGILWKRAEAKQRRGDPQAALADFEASARILETEGARPNLARVLRGWGEALAAVGRASEAKAALHRSLALFEELGIDGEAAAVRAALADPSDGLQRAPVV